MIRKKPPSRIPTPAMAPPEGAPSETDPALAVPIVGLGASAGGLSAFEAFFTAIPDQPTGMAFVLVQHLAPDYKSILVELVGRYTCMPVQEVEDGMEVRPDHVYIIPPNRDLALLKGALHLFEITPAPARQRGPRMPIDFFFRSLAQDQRERAIGIVLAGTGSDGTLGVRAIKGEGGMAMAQAPDAVQYDGMPRSAIATGLVDYVLPAAGMYVQLAAYVKHAFRKPEAPVPTGAPPLEDLLKKIVVILRVQTSHDFSNYKENTLRRRVERRMALHQIVDGEDYLRLLRSNPEEVDALFRDFLIGVTHFFRDPEAFLALKQEGLPALFAGKPPGANLRIWVCGCSTGEEAYTLAMLLQEHMDQLRVGFNVQIFATDIDRAAIEIARAGTYPASIARDVPEPYLKRYFHQDEAEGSFQIRKGLRDLLIFSEQDVIRDPPFSKLDLISCRNLLIYLNAELQKKLLPLFAYALNPGGCLFLGTAETVGEFSSLFTPLNRKLKLYKRKEEAIGPIPLPLAELRIPTLPGPASRLKPGEGKPDPRCLAEQALLGYYVQTGILVNGHGDILHIVGHSGKYLEPPPGEPVLNILAMAREGLRLDLTAAFHRVVARRSPVHLQGLRVQTELGFILADLVVKPAECAGRVAADCYLVILEEASRPGGDKGLEAARTRDSRIEALEYELRGKDENLRTALEEMGTSNEELKSSNEEIQSVNEELQSTNEELETSKEELQSVNEELATVNGELQLKVLELSHANNDMNNLLSSTGVGVLVLDARLRIVRFTPAITQVINLIQADLGRPLAHFTCNLAQGEHLASDLQAVLETLVPREVKVTTHAGVRYLMRIRPYRTQENVIEGLVITCVEINPPEKSGD